MKEHNPELVDLNNFIKQKVKDKGLTLRILSSLIKGHKHNYENAITNMIKGKLLVENKNEFINSLSDILTFSEEEKQKFIDIAQIRDKKKNASTADIRQVVFTLNQIEEQKRNGNNNVVQQLKEYLIEFIRNL